MSDFDKEAEREKLRKKFERDERKRQSTQRMSELLLQGATMTNKHCDRCGDPVFRYDGREFCPTCEGGDADVEATDVSGAGAGSDPDAVADAGAPDASGDAPSNDGEATTRAGEENAPSATANADETRTSAGASAAPNAASASGTTPDDADEAMLGGADGVTADEAGGMGSDETGAADLNAARASLVRTVNRYARAAEEADDPGRARSYLAAVREAAEALDALDR